MLQFLCFTVGPVVEYRETWVQIPVLSVVAVHRYVGYLTSLHHKCKIRKNLLPGQLWELNEFGDILCLALSLAHRWQPGLAALCRQASGATLFYPEVCALQPFSYQLLWFPTCSKNSWPCWAESPSHNISLLLVPVQKRGQTGCEGARTRVRCWQWGPLSAKSYPMIGSMGLLYGAIKLRAT